MGAAGEKWQSTLAKEAGEAPPPGPPPAEAHPAPGSLTWGPAPLSAGSRSARDCPALWAPQTLLPAKRGQQTAGVTHHPSAGRLSSSRTPRALPPALPRRRKRHSRAGTHTPLLEPWPKLTGAIRHPQGGGRAGGEARAPATLADECSRGTKV